VTEPQNRPALVQIVRTVAIALAWLEVPALAISRSVLPVSNLGIAIVFVISGAVVVALLFWVRWEERHRND
jgi:hypothetical protein